MLHDGVSGQLNPNYEDCEHGITFHYLITDNFVSHDRRPAERMRDIYVFLDEREDGVNPAILQ